MLNIFEYYIVSSDIGIIMSQESCNCIVCAKEFNISELKSVALSEINVTRFKICQECFNLSDPTEDYKQAKNIVNSYLEFIRAKHWLKEAESILKLRNNENRNFNK